MWFIKNLQKHFWSQQIFVFKRQKMLVEQQSRQSLFAFASIWNVFHPLLNKNIIQFQNCNKFHIKRAHHLHESRSRCHYRFPIHHHLIHGHILSINTINYGQLLEPPFRWRIMHLSSYGLRLTQRVMLGLFWKSSTLLASKILRGNDDVTGEYSVFSWLTIIPCMAAETTVFDEIQYDFFCLSTDSLPFQFFFYLSRDSKQNIFLFKYLPIWTLKLGSLQRTFSNNRFSSKRTKVNDRHV